MKFLSFANRWPVSVPIFATCGVVLLFCVMYFYTPLFTEILFPRTEETCRVCSTNNYSLAVSQSPSPMYGPLPAPGNVKVESAMLTKPNEETFVDVSSPIQTNYRNEHYQSDTANVFTQEAIEITGTAGTAIEKIIVSYTPLFGISDVYELKKYKPGDREWKYSASVPLKNLGPGVNTYTIRGYFTFGQRSYYVERTVRLTSGLDSSVAVQSDEGELAIEWISPDKKNTGEFFQSHGVLQAMRLHRTHEKGTPLVEPLESDASLFDEIDIYRIGRVISGLYGGSSVYLYIDSGRFSVYDFYEHKRDIAYLIERTDNSLVRLKLQSTTAPIFVRFHDEHATLDIGIPDPLVIPGTRHQLKLREIETYGHVITPKSQRNSALFSLNDGRTVTFSNDRCLAVPGRDGLERRYAYDFFPITWLEGNRTSGEYSIMFRSCEGKVACAEKAKVAEGKLNGSEKMALIGRTKSGEDVFEVIPNEREHRNPIAYMERVIGNEDGAWKTVSFPTKPANFYAEHPVIFIKDPFGNYFRYILRKYWTGC